MFSRPFVSNPYSLRFSSLYQKATPSTSTNPSLGKNETDPKSPTSPSLTNPSSTAVEDDDEELEDDPDHRQDWTKVTHPKDSWAERERRRSSIWSKVENIPVYNKKSSRSGSGGSAKFISPQSPSSPTKDARRGSILSLWQPGVDKDGKHVLHTGFEDDTE